MKFIIDLIEDVREQIGNAPDFTVHAMLLKEDSSDPEKLIYGGETGVKRFSLDTPGRKLMMKIDASDELLTVGDLIKHTLILDMDAMMYEVKLDVNHQYSDVEVIGFGKSMEEKKYFFFIKL